MKILAFDMDNTLCNTSYSVVVSGIQEGYKQNNQKVLDYFSDNFLNIPVCHFDGWVSEFLYENVISKRTYMDRAKPTRLFGDNGELKEWILKTKEINKDLKVVICTHRGDNISAWMSTYNWLNEREMMEEGTIDFIHSINHVRHSNKVEYLKSFYRTDKILLVDDNPFGSTNVVRDKCHNVVVYDKIDKFKSHENQEVFSDLNKLAELVFKM